MRYGRGHRPDRGGHRKVGWHILRAKIGGDLKPAARSSDLRHLGPPIFDQGQSSGCVSHAGARGIEIAAASACAPLGYTPSMDAGYRFARCIDRAIEGDGFPPLADDGCEPAQYWRGCMEFGVPPMGPLAPDGRFSDLDLARVNDEPKLGGVEAAAQHLIVGPYAVQSFGDERVEDFAVILSNGFPITIATMADDAFEDWDPSKGPIAAPDPRCRDGHYLVLVGHDTLADGHRVFLGANSWSTSWGDAGYFSAAESFVDELRDCYAVRVLKVTP